MNYQYVPDSAYTIRSGDPLAVSVFGLQPKKWQMTWKKEGMSGHAPSD